MIDFGAALSLYRSCPSCGAGELDSQTLDGNNARCRLCGHEFIKPQRLPYTSGWRQVYPQLAPPAARQVEDEDADLMEERDERGWRE